MSGKVNVRRQAFDFRNEIRDHAADLFLQRRRAREKRSRVPSRPARARSNRADKSFRRAACARSPSWSSYSCAASSGSISPRIRMIDRSGTGTGVKQDFARHAILLCSSSGGTQRSSPKVKQNLLPGRSSRDAAELGVNRPRRVSTGKRDPKFAPLARRRARLLQNELRRIGDEVVRANNLRGLIGGSRRTSSDRAMGLAALLQITLMIFFRAVEGRRRLDLRHDRARETCRFVSSAAFVRFGRRFLFRANDRK